ncbi:hypothetical protein RJ640_007043 [Escallonia rubra]|uniref:Protein kinase domain-containing protein n=1 Tax=Escallonia rubra TaxID=112253 RepID=A0AA88RF97_9ASTE|nr:hypothetical protein RJ640_007043 [Escallonia rubra]
MAKPHCQKECGEIIIPYPFGIGAGCYLDKAFEVLCINMFTVLPLLVFRDSSTIVHISLDDAVVHAERQQNVYCYNEWGEDPTTSVNVHLNQQFSISYTRNKFVAIGCDIFAYIIDSGSRNYTSGCASLCDDPNPIVGLTATSCSSVGCCQTTLPKDITSFDRRMFSINTFNRSGTTKPCSIAFFVDKNFSGYTFNITEHITPELFLFPMVYNWVIGNITCHEAFERGNLVCSMNSDCIDNIEGLGYWCHCKQGYQGNHYLPTGCEATSSAAGALILIAFDALLYLKLERLKRNNVKRKFFKRNGGLVLQELITSSTAIALKTKLFSTKEIMKATDNFNESRVLGKGGQGTVYKGMLPDGSVVAVKKSNIVDEDQIGRAVVSDFGLSRTISLSKTHLTIVVGGTFGYQDPDYFRSGQFTEKSDVYAFGVVLAELLTGRKAISSSSSDEGLVIYFQALMKQNSPFEIHDALVANDGQIGEILAVAKLAQRCLHLNAKKRPIMKEVAAVLDQLRRKQYRPPSPRKLKRQLLRIKGRAQYT